MAFKENKSNRSVYFRKEAGESFDSLYKTIVTPDNFDQVMYFVPDGQDTPVPHEVFEKCVFLGCDMTKLGEALKSAMFENCAFLDCDFSYSNPYKSSFVDCSFENNDWHAAHFSRTYFEKCKFVGDDFSASVWRSRYFNKPDDPRSDIVDSSFCECDVRGVDLGIRADNTYFMQCKGPVKTIQFFEQRIGSSWGDGFGVGKDKDMTSRGLNDLKSWNIRELTSGISYRDNGDSQKLREKLDRQQYSNTPPDPLLVCTHVIKMEKLLCDMDQNELYSRDRSPWHNLDGLVSWVESTDTRFPKTVAEFGSNRVLLTEYASRPANRDSFVVDRDKDGRVCGISRKDDAELVIGDGLFGGRGRGSLSIA